MPPLANDLVESTKRYLYSGYQDELNRLNGATDATATTLNLAFDPKGLSRGTLIAIDLEEMFVWNVKERALNVQRGMNGSTAVGHLEGAMVHIKPKFTSFRILQELNNELRDLSAPQNGMFRIMRADIAYNGAATSYDLPGDIISIQEVRAQDYDKRYPKIESYEIIRNVPTSDFASGTGVILHENGTPGRTVRVLYKAPFGLLTTLTDDVPLVTGLPDTAIDIPPMGAALRLVAPREVKRNFIESQGEPRRAEEVPPNAIQSSLRGLGSLRMQRILSEATRLAAQYPIVRP